MPNASAALTIKGLPFNRKVFFPASNVPGLLPAHPANRSIANNKVSNFFI